MGNRLTKIYTRTGDDGLTGLANGNRVAKHDLRIEASGTVDEANCAIGIVLSEDSVPAELRSILIRVQNDLFDVGAELSLPDYSAIDLERIVWLENQLESESLRGSDKWCWSMIVLRFLRLPNGNSFPSYLFKAGFGSKVSTCEGPPLRKKCMTLLALMGK